MDHTGTFEMAAKLAKQHLLTAIYKFATIDQWKLFAKKDAKAVRNSFVSSGTRDGDFDQLQKILNSISTDFICLDVANGYSQHFVDFIKKTREKFPSKIIMAGNVVTGEMTEELILSGADIVKVGIGPGSVCTTRKKTGVGYPQLSAIIECSDAAHGSKRPRLLRWWMHCRR